MLKQENLHLIQENFRAGMPGKVPGYCRYEGQAAEPTQVQKTWRRGLSTGCLRATAGTRRAPTACATWAWAASTGRTRRSSQVSESLPRVSKRGS